MNPGDKYSAVCPQCSGNANGIFGGTFYVGYREIEYTQILNAKCSNCGFSKAETFEVWDADRNDFYPNENIVIPISGDADICFPGLGLKATEITPELKRFLKAGI